MPNGPLEIDIPEIRAEVEAAFATYETALVTNDVAMLDALFHEAPTTIRYGGTENLYGFAEIAAFRAGRSPKGLTRSLDRAVITTYGRDFAVASTLFRREASPDKVGRQMQTWMRTSKGWRVVAAHVSVIPDPDHPANGPETIDLAVVGAHMTGLPLNSALQALGAAFRRATRTAPGYRLFALPGSNPARPGLIRVADGKGHAIETEIWALSPAAFGSFVAAIPSPLGIGTVRLEDGSTVKGFLCEQEGTLGAEDISRFGGWRAYLTASAEA
ncbi:Allophanate hydrolase [Hartmannibacter diazotrophicus]|uniref:Allophanate hydrolase n=1 Tax=Hartmannibacter diazotrophicus TaxID=1482074 RepID=A0A2C9D9G2_9HYPH|nr:Allophanate hydrolase [Hartmannibacter diazotrophicus]